MKRKWIDFGLSIGVGVAIVVALMALLQAGTAYQPMGVTRFDSLHLKDSGGTATPVFVADQEGTGVIAEFQDSGSVMMRIMDGGLITMSGSLNVGGNVTATTLITSYVNLNASGTLVVDGDVSSGSGAFTVADTLGLYVSGPISTADHLNLPENGEIRIAGSREYTFSSTGFDLGTNVITWTGGITTAGPIRYGLASAIISGSTIAHGLGSTPQFAMVEILTRTHGANQAVFNAFVYTTDEISVTVGFTPAMGSQTVYWIVGR